MSALGNGSSPLTRGRRHLPSIGYTDRRIIPAYAGSTAAWRRLRGRVWDHPRLRGVDIVSLLIVSLSAGSSPLTRGRPSSTVGRRRRRGIIPAYAGSTYRSVTHLPKPWDHPRLRGVDRRVMRRNSSSAGSSPLTRGRRTKFVPDGEVVGIIPAYAGSTWCRWSDAIPVPDHPRLRGVDHPVCWRGPSGDGSSPLTRGRPETAASVLGNGGIIPAYAGSTTNEPRNGLTGPDHPRLRGVDADALGVSRQTVGSSPLTRGRLTHCLTTGWRRRIIPAYAGSTLGAGPVPGRPGDHPRLRGVDSASRRTLLLPPGSSPLTRGRR